jgi:glycerate-2-kinase
LVQEHLRTVGAPFDQVATVVGAGKAAAHMARGAEAALGANRLTGLVIVPPGCSAPLASVRVAIGSHPLPDERSLRATVDLCQVVDRQPAAAPLLCLVSGGASSLLVQPQPPLSLADKMAVNRLLLECGAEIAEINTVRKHLSTVKGGGLARRAGGRPILTLALSDVIGDQPSIIGSGPAVPDPTTYAEALAVLEHYSLAAHVPPAVRELLVRGVRGELVETLKPESAAAHHLSAAVVGSNRTALAGAAIEARRLGYEPLIDPEPLVGDSATAARAWAARLRRLPRAARWCAIAGGETTVVVRGGGRGGRNQEFALGLAQALAGESIVALSAGSDGIDGPTDAAGAFVDGVSGQRAAALGLDVAAALADNDSYPFFDRLDDLLRCGPTGTNVMDVKVAVGVGS